MMLAPTILKIPTLKELVEFVLINRVGTKAFMPVTEWTPEVIERTIRKSLLSSCAAYVLSAESKIVALGIGHFENEDIYHCSNILSIDPNGFYSIMCMWCKEYPNIKFFTMYRRGKLKTYSTEKFYKHILS